MHVVVATSNRYVHLMPAFAWCFNEQWPSRFWPRGTPITVLHYNAPPPPLPPNFTLYYGGDQAQISWSAGLKRYVETLPPRDAVCLLLDDYWLFQPVDILRLEELHSYIDTNPDVDKIDLSGDRMRFPHEPGPRADLVAAIAHPAVYNPEGSFKSKLFLASTQAALWRAGYLANLLRDDESAWEFERNGTARLVGARSGSILGVRDPVLHYANATKAGKPMLLRETLIPAALLADLRAVGLLAPWGMR